MGTISDKLTYLNETKQLLKKAINDLGGDLTEESTFRSYSNALDTIYNEYPKVSDEGTEITLENTNKGRIEISQKGQTSQESTSGKNLLNNTATNRITHGLTITVNEDKTITINGTADANVEFAIASVTLPVGTYIFSGLTNSTTDYAYINFSGIVNIYSGEVERTINTEITTSVRLLLFNGKTYNKLTIYPMIRLASITDGTYEPYTGGIPAPNPDFPYPIKKVSGNNNVLIRNKNLFDKDTVIDGKEISGINIQNNSDWCVSDFIVVDYNKTYIKNISNGNTYLIYDKNKNQINTSQIYFVNNKTTITDKNAKYIRINLPIANKGTYQLEQGSTATTYVPHQEQNFPLTLGDLEVYEDGEFIKNGTGEWYLKNKYGKVIFDGTENWQNWNIVTTEPLVGFLLDGYVDYDNSSGTDVRGLSNYFKVFANAMPTQQSIGLRQTGDSIKRIYLAISNEIVSNLGEFKSWLSNHNTELVYLSATPTFTKITSLTLIDELENIKNNAKSYKDVTNISQTNDDLPFIITTSGLMKGSD